MSRTQTFRAKQPKSNIAVRAFAAAAFSCLPLSAALADGAGSFATSCALRDIKVVTLIEEHGEAQILSSARLFDAAQTMLRARATCAEGNVGEALAMYDGILSIGPVVNLQK